MTFQWCLPQTQGRGAGLGNELVPWARAFLMAQVLRARWLHPAFGLNCRGYRRHFGTPAWDWLVHRAMAAGLPHVRFDEADHLAHGGGDVTESFARFAQAQGLAERGPLVVLTSGMWGGIHHIARAREFVRGALYGARHAAHNLAELSSRLHPDKLTVAMHVRLGDFEAASPGLQTYRGRFNCALPLEWFMQIGHQLRDHWGDAIQFQVFSDGDPQALAPLLQLLKPVNTRCAHPADVSDLLALSRADLLVCSVSSYSIWAAALSEAPYLWFRHQMHDHGDGWHSIWGHEPGQQTPGSATLQALADPGESAARGFALGVGATLPPSLVSTLRGRWAAKRRAADLVRYGVVRLIEENLP